MGVKLPTFRNENGWECDLQSNLTSDVVIHLFRLYLVRKGSKGKHRNDLCFVTVRSPGAQEVGKVDVDLEVKS